MSLKPLVATLLIGVAGCAHRPVEPTYASPIVPPAPAMPSLREEVIDLGASVEGRPIRMHVLGTGDRPTLVLGAIHGSERTSHTVAQRLLEYVREHPEIVQSRAV